MLQEKQSENTSEKTGIEAVPQNDRQGENQTGAETGSGGVLEPDPTHISVRTEHASVDPLNPRPWKHHSSHPLDQILSDINTGVQTRSKFKNFFAFYAFLSNIEPKSVNEALQIQIGSQLCKKNFINLKETKFGTLYHDQLREQSLEPSGCSETN